MRKLAVFLSWVAHPVLALTWLVSFFIFSENYFSYFMSPAKKIFLLAAVLIFSVALPLLNTWILKRLGFVKSVYMNSSSERVMPYISSLVLHAGLFYIMHDLAIPFFFKYIILSSVAVIGALFLVNFFLRISAHAASMGGIFGVLCFYEFINFQPSLLPLCVCLALSGLVAFARLYLQAHTGKQVYLGFITGFGGSLLCLFLLVYFNYSF
jgi:hypothetical protein